MPDYVLRNEIAICYKALLPLFRIFRGRWEFWEKKENNEGLEKSISPLERRERLKKKQAAENSNDHPGPEEAKSPNLVSNKIL